MLALKTLKAVMEEKVTSVNVDIAVVAPTFKLYSKVSDLLMPVNPQGHIVDKHYACIAQEQVEEIIGRL